MMSLISHNTRPDNISIDCQLILHSAAFYTKSWVTRLNAKIIPPDIGHVRQNINLIVAQELHHNYLMLQILRNQCKKPKSTHARYRIYSIVTRPQ